MSKGRGQRKERNAVSQLPPELQRAVSERLRRNAPADEILAWLATESAALAAFNAAGIDGLPSRNSVYAYRDGPTNAKWQQQLSDEENWELKARQKAMLFQAVQKAGGLAPAAQMLSFSIMSHIQEAMEMTEDGGKSEAARLAMLTNAIANLNKGAIDLAKLQLQQDAAKGDTADGPRLIRLPLAPPPGVGEGAKATEARHG